MPNTRITDLPDAPLAAETDLLFLVDATAVPAEAKKITANLLAGLAPVTTVADKTGAVSLQIADIAGAQTALAACLDSDNYIEFAWATRTITGTVSNYSVLPANMVRLNTIGSATITGFSGGTSHAWHRIINVSRNNITIAHQNAQSIAANRILLPGNENRVLYPDQDAVFFYDPIVQRWRSPGCPYPATS